MTLTIKKQTNPTNTASGSQRAMLSSTNSTARMAGAVSRARNIIQRSDTEVSP